jgi:hypothetical protein
MGEVSLGIMELEPVRRGREEREYIGSAVLWHRAAGKSRPGPSNQEIGSVTRAATAHEGAIITCCSNLEVALWTFLRSLQRP